MRSLTALEAQFLDRVKSAVEEGKARFKRVFLTDTGHHNPALELGLETTGTPSVVYYKVLIYGTRPVRYHIETAACPEAERYRSFWNRLLGALNLVEEKSGLKNKRLHLFYEVKYPEQELKKLGER